jgi:fibro-slime domain-containing protein
MRRILAVAVAMSLLVNAPLFLPREMPASADSVYGGNGETAGLRELYADIPNGTVMPDGSVLLYYSLWDFEARYQNALYYGNRFEPETVPLPFETEGIREEFLAGYRNDTWYLLDVVYSGGRASDGSFAYVVKSGESGLVNIILSTKNGEEFLVHIESDVDGEAMSAELIQFEEVRTVVELEWEEWLPEDEAAEDGAIEGEAAEAGAAEGEPAEGEAAEEARTPDPDENTPAKEEAGTDGASGDTDESGPAESGLPAEGTEGNGEAPAPAEETEGETRTEENTGEGESLVAPEPEAIPSQEAAGGLPEPEAVPGPILAPHGRPAEKVYTVGETEVPLDEAPGDDSDEAPGDDPGEPEKEAPPEEAKHVIIEYSLDETTENLGYTEMLEENIEAKPLAALAIRVLGAYAATVAGDTAAVPFGERPAGLGDILKSALVSAGGSSAVYGAAPVENTRFFPVNMYKYMGTLKEGSALSYFANEFDTDINRPNFNTPSGFTERGGNGTYYKYNGIDIKSYFLFSFPKVIGKGINSTGLNYHGDQNRASGGNYLPAGVMQGIAKPKLGENGEFEINFATMLDLGLFPRIEKSLEAEKMIYIYGMENEANGVQQTSPLKGNPGMIQAYPNYDMPFVDEGGGYYTFDSDKTRVQLNSNNKRLEKISKYSNNSTGFFPFGTPGAANSFNFGLNMEVDFVLPPGGKMAGKDIVFKFSGDDDLWVYIDGCQLLDLGGLHQRQEGEINFSTKKVTTLASGSSGYISKLTPGGSGLYYPGTSTKNRSGPETKTFGDIVGDSFEKSFGDYTPHRLQIFYMERDPSDANCKISFNLPVIEKDKLNLFKFADEYIGKDEEFIFDVYTADGDSRPAVTSYGNSGGKQVYLKKGGSFPMEIDKVAGTWVRVVERPTADGNQPDRYSTVFFGSANNGIVTRGKDSGWIHYDGNETGSLFCVNYAQHPIELTKYRLDGATRDADGTVTYQRMKGVEFDLHRAVMQKNGVYADDGPVGALLKTDEEGAIILNDIYDEENSPKLERGKTYILWERKQDNYAQAPPIYFRTTQGVSPLVDEIWYYDDGMAATDGNRILYKTAGQTVFASESGRKIDIYNRRLTGSVTVEKTLEDIGSVSFDSQGAPVFLFRLEKFGFETDGGDGGGIGERLPGIHTLPVSFEAADPGNPGEKVPATKTATFENLEAGYFYRISELDAVRYGPAGSAGLTGAEDRDGDANTVTFLLTDGLAAESLKNPGAVTAKFANSRNYGDYLSDTLVAVNGFTYTPPRPAPSSPTVHTVRVQNSSGKDIETLRVADGDLIDISGLSVKPKDDGAIGEIGIGKSKFYPHTSITGSCTIKLY